MDFIKIKNKLNENGYAIIKNFLNESEADLYARQFEDIIKFLTVNGKYPTMLHSGMIQYIGHSEVQWKLRIKSKVIFEELLECKELATSFDGFCYMDGNKLKKRVKIDSFLHRDQTLSDFTFQTIQGLINLSTNDQVEKGGFVCIPKSHLIKDFQKILN